MTLTDYEHTLFHSHIFMKLVTNIIPLLSIDKTIMNKFYEFHPGADLAQDLLGSKSSLIELLIKSKGRNFYS